MFGVRARGRGGRRQQRVHQPHALTRADRGGEIAALLQEIAGEPVQSVACPEIPAHQPWRLGRRCPARPILGQRRRHGVQQRFTRDWKESQN
jgi:hypothetical protein